jgi:hypothetical protein
MNPEDLQVTPKTALVLMLEEFNRVNEEVMTNMVMIREELLHRLEDENKDGEIVGEYSISKSKRTTFKTTFEQAQELGAVKPAVDTETLRNLLKKGIDVPGVQVTTFLSVRKLQKKDGE